jgi:hypothetical protein
MIPSPEISLLFLKRAHLQAVPCLAQASCGSSAEEVIMKELIRLYPLQASRIQLRNLLRKVKNFIYFLLNFKTRNMR